MADDSSVVTLTVKWGSKEGAVFQRQEKQAAGEGFWKGLRVSQAKVGESQHVCANADPQASPRVHT